MNLMEQMLSDLPRLRHFEVIANGSDDMIDGHQWERSAKNLLTFQFNFYIPYAIETQHLDSFRTPFWLNHKQWFVAYRDNHFFSVPHFMKMDVFGDYPIPQYTTVSDIRMFYRHINQLTLMGTSDDEITFCPYVQTLKLCCSPSIQQIRKAVSCRQIRNLSLYSIGEEFPIKSFINKMPKLSQLTITDAIDSFLKNFRYKQLNKIQTLKIGNSFLDFEEYNIELLCAVFSNIKHLHVDHLCSTEQIFTFLHRLPRLSTASFFCIKSSDDGEKNSHAYVRSRVGEMGQMHALHFTYRFDASRIFLWF
jgi:hypothetical protein